LIKKISDKDIRDWENFLKDKKKISNKNFVKDQAKQEEENTKSLNKNKQDWENFIKNKEKVPNKDSINTGNNRNTRNEKMKKIDLHGYTIEEANKVVEQFIQKCFDQNISKIIVITGKGLRSKNIQNPYFSKDLSLLKYSVPEFIENNKELTKIIIEIKDARIEDGGSGAFYIYLKKKYVKK
tara:strand:+ start:84 stop:629 length:546 start_codon:yes stop_codon:yes gene_type:complete